MGGRRLRIGLVAAAVFIVDLLTKQWVSTHLQAGQSIQVIPGLFSLTYVSNAGAAFGLLQNQTLLFIAITVVVVALIVTYGRRAARHQPLLGLAFGMQLGGALGNLLDRLLYARVIDFLDVRGFPYVFNIADSAIVVGGILFALVVLREPQTQPEPEAPPSGRRDG